MVEGLITRIVNCLNECFRPQRTHFFQLASNHPVLGSKKRDIYSLSMTCNIHFYACVGLNKFIAHYQVLRPEVAHLLYVERAFAHAIKRKQKPLNIRLIFQRQRLCENSMIQIQNKTKKVVASLSYRSNY